MAQLVKRSLPLPEIRGSNLVYAKVFNTKKKESTLKGRNHSSM